MPGCGSASRAGPIGISGDAATAMATATSAPVTVTIASLASDRMMSAARSTPSTRRMGNSAASSASCLASSWPMTASAISAASPAKTASAMASGPIARSVALTWSDRLMVMTSPPVPGYRLASVRAVLVNAVSDTPGCSRTAASSPKPSSAAAVVAANGELTSAVGSLPFAEPVGTISSSNATIAVTRNVSVTALLYSGAPLGALGTPYRRSVPPGVRCSSLASCSSTIACPGAFASYSVPARTLTRSTLTPMAPSGLDMTFTGAGSPRDSVSPYRAVVVIAAMCGSRSSAR
jgi:hypothetical protein